MARREKITVMIGILSRPGRLIRMGEHVFIQLDKRGNREQRAAAGMHELAHYWRDDPGDVCYHVEDDAFANPAEEFADIFAWVVTSPARIFLKGVRDEDFL